MGTYVTAMWAALLATSHAHLLPRQQSPLTWGPCQYEIRAGSPNPPILDCAQLDVPLDYTQTGGETIQLQLTRLKALERPSKGSVLFNPGGPGAPGADSLLGGAELLLQ
jgi:hypothetical protein